MSRTVMAELFAGSSGWSYASWRPDFYPAGLANEEFLSFYSQRLPSVELNSTGYRLPAEEQFERWAAQVPDGFRFAVKMPQRALRSLGTFEERVRRLGERLGPGAGRRREPARRRPARAAARLDRAPPRPRPARRELGRRRRRAGGSRERLGGRRAVPLPPLPRAAVLGLAARTSSPRGSGHCSTRESRCSRTSATRTSRPRPGTRSSSSTWSGRNAEAGREHDSACSLSSSHCCRLRP